jgi:quercetin dioxygenase-like cupin family protein
LNKVLEDKQPNWQEGKPWKRPAEVKHWHGAQKDSWFQHLTYHKDVQEEASNEWCEPVADEMYDTLK